MKKPKTPPSGVSAGGAGGRVSPNEIQPTRAMSGRESGRAEEGVKRCMKLMTSARWRTGVSDAKLAAEYDVSVITVRGWAAQAARTLRIIIGDSEEVRARLVVLFEDIHAQARKDKDWKAAVAAVSKQAELLGLVDKREVSVNVNVQSYETLDDAAMLTKVEAQIAKLNDVRSRLLMKQSIPALMPAETETNDVER